MTFTPEQNDWLHELLELVGARAVPAAQVAPPTTTQINIDGMILTPYSAGNDVAPPPPAPTNIDGVILTPYSAGYDAAPPPPTSPLPATASAPPQLEAPQEGVDTTSAAYASRDDKLTVSDEVAEGEESTPKSDEAEQSQNRARAEGMAKIKASREYELKHKYYKVDMKSADTGAPTPLAGKALGAKYKDEDKKRGWRTNVSAHKEKGDVTTKYFNEQERSDSALNLDHQGRLVDSKGQPVTGQKGFVMNPKDGQLHGFKENDSEDLGDGKTKWIHHSSPLAGGDVAGAGNLEAEDGIIKKIDDGSGHYKPSAKETYQTIKNLEERGARMVDTRPVGSDPANKPAEVTLVGKIGISEDEWGTVKGSLDKINALLKKKTGRDEVLKAKDVQGLLTSHEVINKKIAAALAVTLTTQQFLQTEGNEEAIRAKKTTMQELKDKHGQPPEESTSSDMGQPKKDRAVSYTSFEEKE